MPRGPCAVAQASYQTLHKDFFRETVPLESTTPAACAPAGSAECQSSSPRGLEPELERIFEMSPESLSGVILADRKRGRHPVTWLLLYAAVALTSRLFHIAARVGRTTYRRGGSAAIPSVTAARHMAERVRAA